MPDELHTNSTECETDDLSFVISVLGAEKAHKHLTKDGFTVHELAEAARSIIARGESLEDPEPMDDDVGDEKPKKRKSRDSCPNSLWIKYWSYFNCNVSTNVYDDDFFRYLIHIYQYKNM